MKFLVVLSILLGSAVAVQSSNVFIALNRAQFSIDSFDPYSLAEAIMKASLEVPPCLRGAIAEGKRCPAECFEVFNQIRNVFEDFAQDNRVLRIGRTIGYVSVEAQKLCENVGDLDWTMNPNPPPFEVADLTPVGLAGIGCIEALANAFAGRSSDFCPMACARVVSETGPLLAKYMNKAIGAIVQRLGESAHTLCIQESGVCALAPVNQTTVCQTARGMAGSCVHGSCSTATLAKRLHMN